MILQGKSISIGYLRNKQDNWDVTLRDLKEPAPQSGHFDVGALGKLKTVSIWNDEKADVFCKSSQLVFSNLKYGLLLRFDQ